METKVKINWPDTKAMLLVIANLSKNKNCANTAKAILEGKTTIEHELKYSGHFMTAVLEGDYVRACRSADSDNLKALKRVYKMPFKEDTEEDLVPFNSVMIGTYFHFSGMPHEIRMKASRRSYIDIKSGNIHYCHSKEEESSMGRKFTFKRHLPKINVVKFKYK